MPRAAWCLLRGDGGGIGRVRAGRGFTVRAGDAIRRGGDDRLRRCEFKAGSFHPAHGAIHGRCECRGPQPSASRAGRWGGRECATGRPGRRSADAKRVRIPESGIPIPPMAASVIAGCPRDLLTRLLAGVANKEDALSALAIEHETLKLCHERQLIVTGIFETEAQLRALRAPAEPAAANRSPAVAATVPSVMPQLNTVPAKLPAPSTTARKPRKPRRQRRAMAGSRSSGWRAICAPASPTGGGSGSCARAIRSPAMSGSAGSSRARPACKSRVRTTVHCLTGPGPETAHDAAFCAVVCMARQAQRRRRDGYPGRRTD